MEGIKFEQVTRCTMPLTQEEFILLSYGEDGLWFQESTESNEDGELMFGADHMEIYHYRKGYLVEFFTEDQSSAEVVLKRVQKFLSQGMKNNE